MDLDGWKIRLVDEGTGSAVPESVIQFILLTIRRRH